METKQTGKAYTSRKPLDQRPESDFYPTPRSLTRELIKLDHFSRFLPVHEPAMGNGDITSVLRESWMSSVTGSDLSQGVDFLNETREFPQIITNPPFSLFDEFVSKAQSLCPHFAFIGKVNFFGAYKRSEQKGTWRGLSRLYIFNRQLDYRTPSRHDGLFHVGNLITGWFIWDMEHVSNSWDTSIMDVQKYAKLGQYVDFS